MKQNKSKKIIIILIVIITIILVIGGIAFAYLTTDIFRSNKDLFFKYTTQLGDTKNGMVDSNLKKYFENKSKASYTNEGNFRVNVTSDEEQEKYKEINNFNISFLGQVDKENKKEDQEISLNYSDSVKFPINYKKIGDSIGLQTKYVGSKFIVAQKDKLDKLSKIETLSNEELDGVESSATTTIDFQDTTKSISKMEELTQIELTNEEKEHIRNTYIGVLNQTLSKDKFSKVKENNKNGYVLSLTGEEFKNVIISILETLKNDQVTLDKVNEYLKVRQKSSKITESDIDNEIKTINNNSDLNEENIEITVYSKNGKTAEIIIKTDKMKIDLEKINTQVSLEYHITLEVAEDDETYKIYLNANYSGLSSMQTISENYEAGIETSQIQYKYQFDNSINFTNNINIEEFTKDNSMILTDYEQEQISNFITAVTERITAVNKQQMEQLGLKENENPIQYIIPMEIIMQANSINIMDKQDLSELEVNTFNQKFEVYESTNLQGTTVKGLISTISRNNGITDEESSIQTDEETNTENITHKIEEINYNGEEYDVNQHNITFIRGDIDISKNYRVEFEKDQDTGIIYRAVISVK